MAAPLYTLPNSGTSPNSIKRVYRWSLTKRRRTAPRSMSKALTELQDKLQAQKEGSQWKARCPAHADEKPSLSIAEKSGKILLHCHAGCTTEAVCESLSLSVADLFTEPLNDSGSRIVETYP